jgi:TolB-like protein
MQFLRNLRLERARRDLLRAPASASVTEIATRHGFDHLGRFAARYVERYGEPPSATLRRNHGLVVGSSSSSPPLTRAAERPAIAVLPFDLVGPGAVRAETLAEEIAAALWRLHWLTVTAPAGARYHVRGKAHSEPGGRVWVSVVMVDAHSGRHLWADRFDGRLDDLFEFEEQVAVRIAHAIQPALRGAEIDRAWRRDRERLTAWELTMRALPCVLSFEPASEGTALDLLEQAIEAAPQDPLPLALASWCHGLRAGHHFTPRPQEERTAARSLAARAAALGGCDPLAETLVACGYTLAHDLATAAVHVDRALALDGGSAWAWGRSGWVKAYAGDPAEAIERFQIARAIAPADPLAFLWSIGIGAAHFEAARYDEAARWYTRGRAEQPTAVWNNRFLAPAYALAGRKEEARQTLAELRRAYPELTIAQVRLGLPYSPSFLDRVADGLESVGMPP